MIPYSILLAVLITFGLLQRTNEITAIKATGMSIYRIIMPILLASAILATGLFFFDQFYLPHANKRQDALRNMIKGKPAQTYLNPDRKWIFGEHSTIYYYQLFDSDKEPVRQSLGFPIRSGEFPTFARTGSMQTALIGMRVCNVAGFARKDGNANCAAPRWRVIEPSMCPRLRISASRRAYFKKEIKQSQEMNL